MSTAPYTAAAAQLVAGTHRQDYAVRATHPDWPAPVPLTATDVRVGWDGARAPRCTATITVPAAGAPLELLDPLAGVRLQVDAGYLLPDGQRDVHTVADLGLRGRVSSAGRDTVDLYAAGSEARILDNTYHPDVGLQAVNPGSTTTSMIAALIAGALAGYDHDIVVTGPTGPDVTAEEFAAMRDQLDGIVDLADGIGSEAYDDGTGTWRIAPRRTTPAAVPDAVLTTGPGGTITDLLVDVSREGWANDVIVTYRWRPAGATVDSTLTARATASGDLDPNGPAGRVRYVVERAGAATASRANAAAYALLGRMLSRSHVLRLTAVAAWWLRPGMTVEVRGPGLTTARHLIAAVEFDAARGLMSLSTRQPTT